MNDIADRKFDPHVERTRLRPLASGELRLGQAVAVFLTLMILAFLLVLQTNLMTIRLAFVGAALAATYPFFKRFTHWPQIVLGIAFGWGIPMAFAAETGAIPWPAWYLLAINTVWSVIYDTLYAMVDRDDDLAVGVKSTAILFGSHDVPIVAILMAVMLALLVFLGLALDLEWPWSLGVLLATVLFLQQLYSVRKRNRNACFRAFQNNNWVGFVVFLGLLGHFVASGKLFAG